MPQLDAERVGVWRAWCRISAEVQRRVDAALRSDSDPQLSLAWFEVLAALAAHKGRMRVHELVEELAEVPSSMSRRLDRLEDDGYIERDDPPAAARVTDRRAVMVVLTAEGRAVWRDALQVYRRAVQREFAQVLTDSDLTALVRVFAKLPVPPEPPDPDDW